MKTHGATHGYFDFIRSTPKSFGNCSKIPYAINNNNKKNYILHPSIRVAAITKPDLVHTIRLYRTIF